MCQVYRVPVCQRPAMIFEVPPMSQASSSLVAADVAAPALPFGRPAEWSGGFFGQAHQSPDRHVPWVPPTRIARPAPVATPIPTTVDRPIAIRPEPFAPVPEPPTVLTLSVAVIGYAAIRAAGILREKLFGKLFGGDDEQEGR